MIGWSLAIVLLVAAIAVPVWWQIDARSSAHLESGGETWAAQAWRVQAGRTDEMCFGFDAPGPLKFGFSLRNPSSHDVKIVKIPQIISQVPQQVTYTRPSSRDAAELPFKPLVLAPGDDVMLYVTFTIPANPWMQPGTATSFSTVPMRVRVLDVNSTIDAPIGSFVRITRAESGKLPCQPIPPLGS
jgi:hypothetical protein